MEVVVPVGQGWIDAPERGGDDAVDHNQLFQGNDRVDTLAFDFVDRHHLLTSIHCLHAVAHSHLVSSDERQGGQSTRTGGQHVIHGHLEVATRLSSDLRKRGVLFVAAVGKVRHLGQDLFALGIDRQHAVTHLHICQCLGVTVLDRYRLRAQEAAVLVISRTRLGLEGEGGRGGILLLRGRCKRRCS